MDRYIRRALEVPLRRASSEFPVVALTGPRQSGKTTLLKHSYGGSHRYVSLEPPDVRAAAAEDPRGFLDAFPAPAILDEVQYAPDLLPYIKERVDARRDVPGQYLLSGSQNLMLMERVSESLAGRVAILRLLPLSLREINGAIDRPFPWEGDPADVTSSNLWPTLLQGGYPELSASPGRDLALWHASYVQTYLERDVRLVRNVGDLTLFQNFLNVLAARSGQLLSLTDVARDLGIAVNTAKAWLSVLEASHQVVVLRPWFANVGKRLVKTPKVYFTDTGTLCHLVGLKTPDHAAAGPMAGVIFETAVLSEIARTYYHRGEVPRVYFWRTSAGSEVDFLIDTGTTLVTIEVKLSATPRPAMARALRTFREDLAERCGPSYVVHPGDTRLPLGGDVTALPFAEL